MNKKQPCFHYSECVSCSICVQSCPLSCLSLSRKGKQGKYRNVFPEMMKKDICIGCGTCAASCPMKCITMTEG